VSRRRRSDSCLQVDKFREEIRVHFAEMSRRNLTVEILRGEFTKFREPSDRVEEQGSYGLKPLHQDCEVAKGEVETVERI
jgi:hypothetical protein